VKSVRVTSYSYYHTCAADIANTGPALKEVTATLTSLSPHTQVGDGNLLFGDVGASTKRSLDTFTIRHDHRFPFDPSQLSWAISYLPSNTPPVANAGPDQTVSLGPTALSGTASTDRDGDLLTHRWMFLARPAGSAAVLSDSTAPSPTFVVDRPGNYRIQLVVSDETVESAPDAMTVSTQNSPPVAEAGPNQTVLTGERVQLNGSGSTDVDGDPLTYRWSITTKPARSKAELSGPRTVNPTFTADKSGNYVIR
jgi:hypothetical protein